MHCFMLADLSSVRLKIIFNSKARRITYSLLLRGCLQRKQYMWTVTTNAEFVPFHDIEV